MNDKNKKPQKQTITKRKREDAFRKNKFGAFDFETTALDGVVVFGTLQYELDINGERSEVYEVRTAADLYELLWENNCHRMRWYAHNLEFDLLFLLEVARDRLTWGELTRVDLCERGMGNFYKAVFHRADGKKLELYDSLALFGFSLKVFLKQFSKVGEKLELDFENETFDPDNEYHRAYAAQDTRGLLDAMVNFDAAIYQIFGVHAKGTISGTALAAWEVTLENDDKFFKLTKPQSDFVRNAYFGGLVFLTDTTEKTDMVSLDVNSMYPYVMRKFGVPVGVPQYTRKVLKDRPGIYRAKFSAPHNLDFGCVGFRDKKGVAWPRGDFESYAFDFEIERALNWGYDVKIIEGIVFRDYAFPFSKFVDLCESQRALYKGQAFEIVVKLIQNSVYGKFGTKDDGAEIAIFADENDITKEWYPYIDPNSGAMVLENVYKKDVERDTYYMLPHWAAHITARARGELLDIVEVSEGATIYGDTDSAKMPREVYLELLAQNKINCGAAYGQLKLDAEYLKFRAIAPKVYAYHAAKKSGFIGPMPQDGKGKGIPEKQRTADFWSSVFIGDKPTVNYTSLGSLQSTLKKGGERKLNKATRTSTDLDNSVGWVQNNGRVKSIIIKNGEREK